MYHSLTALCIGFLLDFLLGDPDFSWHPIRLIGRLIASMEKVLRKRMPKTKSFELAAGVVLVIFVAGISTALPVLLLAVLYGWNYFLGLAVESFLCYQLLATKSLKVESMKVYDACKKGDTEEARKAVSMIVGRDTDRLTPAGIIKAAVETVAENTSDGSIAPMFYMVLGGVGLGFFYKAVNTMDSMVGYKNETYLYFGRFAAKMDDLLNFVPARLSAYLMILSTLLTGHSVKDAWRIYHRDRYNHASPNSAHTEAAAAGALQIQLAGDTYYFGKLFKKKTIGDDTRPVHYEDIRRANRLLYWTAVLGMILFVIVKILILWIFR